MFRTIHHELAAIFRLIEIDSPLAFRFRDEAIALAGLPPAVSLPGHPFHPVPPHPMVRGLQGLLYRHCYSHRLGGAAPAPQSLVGDPQLIAQLSAANRSTLRWDEGWRIYRAEAGGRLYLIKGGQQHRSEPGDYVLDDVTLRGPEPGAEVRIRMARESLRIQPGLYFMLGEEPGDVWDEAFTVRLYFNTSAETVALLVAGWTELLNRYRVAYRMKTPTDPSAYSRVDTTVLYVSRRDAAFVTRLIGYLPEAALAALGEEVPMFTKRLRGGVGLAEDPGTGESFGMHRCRLVAEGIVEAYEEGSQALGARARAVANRFAANGLRLEAPYVNAGQLDHYALAPEPGDARITPREAA